MNEEELKAAQIEADVPFGSKREELRLSRSGPLWLNERASDRRGATSQMGQKRKCLLDLVLLLPELRRLARSLRQPSLSKALSHSRNIFRATSPHPFLHFGNGQSRADFKTARYSLSRPIHGSS